MSRAFLATSALVALLVVAVSAETQLYEKQPHKVIDPWDPPRKYPLPLPHPKPRDPCANCADCLAIDYYDRPGEIKCQKCEDGYILKGGFCIKKPCRCPRDIWPVCGANGKTYMNKCQAKCDKVDVECDGKCPCKPKCICPKIYAPICGNDGKTYSNKCEAKCAGVWEKCDGKCPCKPTKPPRACPKCIGDPCEHKVCWKHPQAKCRTKDCSCEAEFVLWNRVVDCDEKPPPPPICPYGRRPVQCLADPCQVTKCEAFPYAKCRANFCGGCKADFFLNGKKVDCEKKPVCRKENNPCRSEKDCCKGMSCCMCPPAIHTPMPYYSVKPGYCTKWCECKHRG